MLRLKSVTKSFHDGESELQVLRGIDLHLGPGESLALLGASGNGKSTLLQIAAGLENPDSGEVLILGRSLATRSERELTLLRRRHLGFVFQQFHLLPNLTALDNVVLPMVYAGIPTAERSERARHALERVGLATRLNNRPNQLSGGQQQRVAIARAIINQPALLLADEPTGALDSQTTAEVLDIFDALHQGGMTVVMVTHEDDVAARAEKIVRFRDGHILG